MFTTLEFLSLAQGFGIATLLSFALALLAFRLGWGIRFRLVGITGFLAVIVVGCFGLSLGLFQHTVIPGTAPFSVIYDTGGTYAVITVSPEIDASTLKATLRQAAYNLFSPGRFGQPGETQLTIRARTLIHPEPGISQPVFLGRIQRSLSQREDENMILVLNQENLKKLRNSAEISD